MKHFKIHSKKGQSAIEYMILLGVVMGFVMVGFKTQLPQAYFQANIYYNEMASSILGPPPNCKDCK